MTDLEEARKRWISERPLYEQLGAALKAEMEKGIRHDGIWADVSSRAKETDSLIRKLIKKTDHTYDSIGDKAGVRVIVRYKDEIEPILKLAGQIFEFSDLENTADRLKPDVVGYLSVHGTICFRSGDPNATIFPPSIYRAELQIRTLAQHLWADMAHDTVYKNDETLLPLPIQLKRRIYILAGTVELMDEEFNRINREIPSVMEIQILKALERHYFKLTTRRGDPEISMDVIKVLAPLYKAAPGQIVSHLAGFYKDQEDVLRNVYEISEQAPNRSVFLFQPEALMIFDLLLADELTIRRTWSEYYPEKELERFANAFGISFD